MKYRFTYILSILLFAGLLPVMGQTAELTETISAEGDVRTGGNTIIVTIHGTTFETTLGTDDALTAGFYAGMSGSTAWNEVIASLQTSDVSVTDDTIATITLPAVADYYITENDTVSFLLPDACLALAGDLAVDDSIVVVNSSTSISYDGTIRGSVDEEDVRTTALTYILELSNNKWHKDILTAGYLTTLKGQFTGAPVFADVVNSLTGTDCALNTDSTILTITFPATSSYFISAMETVSFTPDVSLLRYSEAVTGGGDSFTVDNTEPTVSIPDTTILESSIRSVSHTFIITLTGDEWADPVSSNLKDAFTGDTAWENQINDQLVFQLLDAQHIRVTIPQISDFDIAVAGSVSLSITGSHILHSSGTYSTSESISLTPSAAAVTVSGTLPVTVSEGDIRINTYSIILTLSEESWDPAIESSGTLRETLINGLTSSGAGWSDVLSAILSSDQGDGKVHLNGSQVTIDVPAVPDFEISSAITLHAEIDGSLLDHTPAGISSADFCTINPIAASMIIGSIPASLNESTLNGAILTVKLYEDTFVDGSFSTSNFTLNPDFSNGLRISNNNDIHYVSADSIWIELFYNGGDFDIDTDITLTINGNELTNTSGSLTSSNYITAVANIEPEVSSVSIPDQPMGINDEVVVTITLAVSDDGNTFTLASGTLAGRTIDNLSRVSSTSYTARIVILENTTDYAASADLPVENLQLMNGTTAGIPFSGSISQANDLIDTHRPVVDLISVNGGSYNIGQTVPVVLHADGTGYQLVESLSSVNSIPASDASISWTESGSGVYQLSYTVSEGDPDVSGSLPVEVVMEDEVGNQSIAFNTVSGTSPLIDATVPAIDSMVVQTTGVVRVSESVVVWIYTHESGLLAQSGTMINGVALSAARVSFSALASDTVYALTYTVASGDASVSPGNLECTVVLKDAAGNFASQENGLLNNTVEINTQLPTATIIGGDEVCQGDSVRLYVNMTGSAPFDLIIYRNSSLFSSVTDVSSTYSFWVKPTSSSTYTINTVTDNIGNTTAGSGSADVIIRYPTNVQITNSRTTYANTETRVELTADYGPGIFSGDGVETSTGYFYPAWLEPDGSLHDISYTYTNGFGCVSSDIVQFSVIKDIAQIDVDSINCFNGGWKEIVASNVDGDIGSFELYNSSRVLQTAGLVDQYPDDNRAELDPSSLKGGVYYIDYLFTYGSQPQVFSKQIYIDRFPDLEITEGPTDSICMNDISYELGGNLDNLFVGAEFLFYGDGVSGDMGDGFFFNPASAPLGKSIITYRYISENGCRDSITGEVVNRYVPELSFDMSTTCVSLDGGEVGFINTTSIADSVASWKWSFGDNETSEELSPVHFYNEGTSKNVRLEAETKQGCSARFDSTVYLGEILEAALTWDNDCFLETLPVVFKNKSTYRVNRSSYIWTFYDYSGNEIETINKTDTAGIDYYFSTLDDYRVRLIANNLITETGISCSDTFASVISLKPTIVLADTGYFEQFNAVDLKGSWSSSVSGTCSWLRDVADFAGYEQDPENLSWFTSLPEEREAEESWVISPCYDFRSLERPMIRMDIMRSFDSNRDGAILEYSLSSGSTWTRLGDYDEGYNWYNAYDIDSKPDNSSIGWSGTNMDLPDSLWVEAAHELNELIGQSSVMFRIIYATDGSNKGNDGFAFDNVYIGERSKKVLLEHFTNSSVTSAKTKDDLVDNLSVQDSLDLLTLQYHTVFPGSDPINETFPAPAASRSIFYGVNAVPYAIFDGGYTDNSRYDFVTSSPDENVLQTLALERPKFDIKLNVSKENSYLHVNASVIANEDIDVNKLQLNLAVVEKELTSYTGANGDILFRNVVLALLPDPAGTLFEEDWTLGTTMEESFNWTYRNVEDVDDLFVVGFVQDFETGRIYQAVSSDGSGSTGTDDFISLHEMLLYPNPVQNELIIEPGYIPENDLLIRITTLSGKEIRHILLDKGLSRYYLELSDLPDGMYIISQEENGIVTGRSKLLRLK